MFFVTKTLISVRLFVFSTVTLEKSIFSLLELKPISKLLLRVFQKIRIDLNTLIL